MDRFEAVKPIPFFNSSSIAKSAEFYSSVLQFETHLNPEMVSIAGGPKSIINIYIFQRPKQARGSCMVMLRNLRDVDAMHKHLIDNGVQYMEREEVASWTGLGHDTQKPAKVGPVEDKPWGYRQFDLMDMDGNIMCFFAFLSEE